jgi:hypothetical protein
MSKQKESRTLQEVLESIEAMLEKMARMISKGNIPTSAEEVLLDNEEIMRRFKIADSTTKEWRKKGLLPYQKIGGKVFYHKADIESLIKKLFNK